MLCAHPETSITMDCESLYYRFKRGDRVAIISGRYKGIKGVVDSAVFQRTVDYPDEYAPGYHVILDTGPVVTVRWDQLLANWLAGRATLCVRCRPIQLRYPGRSIDFTKFPRARRIAFAPSSSS